MSIYIALTYTHTHTHTRVYTQKHTSTQTLTNIHARAHTIPYKHHQQLQLGVMDVVQVNLNLSRDAINVACDLTHIIFIIIPLILITGTTTQIQLSHSV